MDKTAELYELLQTKHRFKHWRYNMDTTTDATTGKTLIKRISFKYHPQNWGKLSFLTAYLIHEEIPYKYDIIRMLNLNEYPHKARLTVQITILN